MSPLRASTSECLNVSLHTKLCWPSATELLDICVSLPMELAHSENLAIHLTSQRDRLTFSPRVIPLSHDQYQACALVEAKRILEDRYHVTVSTSTGDADPPGAPCVLDWEDQKPSDKTPLLGLHVPKTAGNTLLTLLQDHFRHRLAHVEEDGRLQDLAPLRAGRLLERNTPPKDRSEALEGFDCLFGHGLSDEWFKQNKPGHWVVWLRDPFQRLISHYCYLQRQTNGRNRIRRLVQEGLSLYEFARLREVKDLQSRYLEGLRLEQFSFVGLSDHFEDGLKLMQWRFGIESTVPDLAINKNPQKATDRAYEVTDELRRIVRNQHRKDTALYAAAKDRFLADLERMGVSAPAGLSA